MEDSCKGASQMIVSDLTTEVTRVPHTLFTSEIIAEHQPEGSTKFNEPDPRDPLTYSPASVTSHRVVNN